MGRHLTWNDRLTIERMLIKGYKPKEIAEVIGCCTRTIYYEIKRATYTHRNHRTWEEVERYNPDGAQKRYEEMLSHKGSKPKITMDDELMNDIRDLIIIKDYSPEAAMFAVNKNGKEYKVRITSVNTIYRAIRNGYIEGVTMRDCPLRGKRKRKKKRVTVQKRPTKGTSIEKRDSVVDERTTFGHWEMDSVIGNRPTKECMLVMTERKTRYEIIEPLANHGAKEVLTALERLQSQYGSAWGIIFKDITCDNGSEFADFESMEKLGVKIYYAHPNAPFERGSNENNNKFVRRKYPKSTPLKATRKETQELQEWMNEYPRRQFDGKSSKEMFEQEMLFIGFT